MPRFSYELAGLTAIEDVPDDLADFYRAQPAYTEVFDEAAVAELKGVDLDEAARAAGVDHLSTLHADEKRAAIVEATTPDPDPAPAGKKN